MNVKLNVITLLASFFIAPSFVSAFPQTKFSAQSPILLAAADCSSSAQQVVAQTGGELLSATPATQNGQAVCKVTVLVKGSSGQRPKKMSVTVPQ